MGTECVELVLVELCRQMYGHGLQILECVIEVLTRYLRCSDLLFAILDLESGLGFSCTCR